MYCVNFGSPRVMEQLTVPKLERTLVLLKERKKKMRQHGSFWHYQSDRDMFYQAMNGPKGCSFVVERVNDRFQYKHNMDGHATYQVKTVKRRNAWYDMLGGHVRQRWDTTVVGNNYVMDGGLRYTGKGMSKDNAIAMFERWGVNPIVMDEFSKPTFGDRKYFTHRLYIHNFPYIRDPEMRDDADWNWRGNDNIDYTTLDVSASNPKNDFVSLWNEALNKHGEKATSTQAAAQKASSDASAKAAAAKIEAEKAAAAVKAASTKADADKAAAAKIAAAKADAEKIATAKAAAAKAEAAKVEAANIAAAKAEAVKAETAKAEAINAAAAKADAAEATEKAEANEAAKADSTNPMTAKNTGAKDEAAKDSATKAEVAKAVSGSASVKADAAKEDAAKAKKPTKAKAEPKGKGKA